MCFYAPANFLIDETFFSILGNPFQRTVALCLRLFAIMTTRESEVHHAGISR